MTTTATDTDNRKRRRLILTVLLGVLLLLVIGLLVRPSGDTKAPVKVDTPTNAAPTEPQAPATARKVVDEQTVGEMGTMIDIPLRTRADDNQGGKVTITVTDPDLGGQAIGFAFERWYLAPNANPDREILAFDNPRATVKDGSRLFLVYLPGDVPETDALTYTVCPEGGTTAERCVAHTVNVDTIHADISVSGDATVGITIPVIARLPGSVVSNDRVTLTVRDPAGLGKVTGATTDRSRKVQSPSALRLTNGGTAVLHYAPGSTVGSETLTYTICRVGDTTANECATHALRINRTTAMQWTLDAAAERWRADHGIKGWR